MPIKFILSLISVIFSIGVVDAQDLLFDNQTYDFGEMYQFNSVTRDFHVTNQSTDVTSLRAFSNLPDGVTESLDRSILKPGESTTIHLKFFSGDRYGATSVRTGVESVQKGKSTSYDLRVAGFIDSVLDNGKPGIDLGVVDANGSPTEKSILLESSDDPNLKITAILETPSFLDAHIGDDGKTLFVKSKRFNALGFSKSTIKLRLNSKLQHDAWVAVLLDQHGNVVPDQNPLVLGLQKRSNRRSLRLQLSSKDGRDFSVGHVSTEPTVHVDVVPVPCLPKPREGCRAFLVAPNDEEKFGQIFGKIIFELPDSKQILRVDLAGLYVADDVEVKTLGQAKTRESNTAPLLDVGQSLQEATHANEELIAPSGNGPLIRWQVGNEAAIYGYGVYRGIASLGNFERIGAIVRAKNSGDNTTSTYQYRDNTAVSGKEYWYYITIFYNNGKKTQLTGPQKVLAK